MPISPNHSVQACLYTLNPVKASFFFKFLLDFQINFYKLTTD